MERKCPSAEYKSSSTPTCMIAAGKDCDEDPLACRRHGMKLETRALDRDIWRWTCEARKNRRLVKAEIQEYARQAFTNAGITNFKASDGWYRRWLCRWRAQPASTNTEIPNKSETQKLTVVLEAPSEKGETEENISWQKKRKLRLSQQWNSNNKLQLTAELDSHVTHDGAVNSESAEQGKVLCTAPRDFPERDGCKNSPTGLQDSGEVISPADDLQTPGSGERTRVMNGTTDGEVENGSVKQLFGREMVSKLPSATCDYSGDGDGNEQESTKPVAGANNSSTICDSSLRDGLTNDLITALSSRGILSLDDASNENGVTTTGVNNCAVEKDSLLSIQSFGVSESRLNAFDDDFSIDTRHFMLGPFSCEEFSENETFCRWCDDFHSRTDCKNQGQRLDDFLELNAPMRDSILARQGIAMTGSCDILNSVIGSQSEIANFVDSGGVGKTAKKCLVRRYLPQFKAKVVAYAMAHSNKASAIKFKVSPNTVSEWMRLSRRGETNSEKSPHVPAVVQLAGPEMPRPDVRFTAWLREGRLKGMRFSRAQLADKASALIAQHGRREEASWFWDYCHRLLDDGVARKQIRYAAPFRAEVARYAQLTTQLAASRLFGVARKRVFAWVRALNTGGEGDRPVRRDPSHYVPDSHVDRTLWEWFSQQSRKPSSRQVREKGRSLYEAAGLGEVRCSFSWYYRWRRRYALGPSLDPRVDLVEWVLQRLDANEYVSLGGLMERAASTLPDNMGMRTWALRFCKRHSHLLQRWPDVSTPLPNVMEVKVRQYASHVQELVMRHSLPLTVVGAMDEVPLHFSTTGVAKRDLLLRRPGFDTCFATLVVCCIAEGSLLPPTLVLKMPTPEDKTDTVDGSTATDDILTFWQAKGCLDTNLMAAWIQQLWVKHTGGAASLLVCDSYMPHTAAETATLLQSHRSHLAVIPGGCSSRLQPLLASGTIQRFKSLVEDYWRDSVEQHWRGSVEGSVRLQSPTSQQVRDWVGRAYAELAHSSKEPIRQLFASMGLVCVDDLAPQPQSDPSYSTSHAEGNGV